MIGVGQPVPPTDIEVSITTGDAPDQDVSGWSNVQIFFRGQETIVRVGSWKPGVSMTAVDRALQTAARDIMTASRRAAQEIRERDKLLGVL
jgi:hypothetical protein